MKTGIMALAIAVVLLMATVQTVAAAAFTAVGNVDYEDGTQVPYGWTVEVWNLDEPELGLQPWHTVTEFTPIAYEYGTSCEYESEDDLIKVRVTSPDGTYVGVNLSRWGDVYIGPSKKTCMDVVVHLQAPTTDTFTKPLATGWNLISLPLTPEDDTTSAVLGNDTIGYDKVYRYDATAPKQFVDVTTGTMEPGVGYFVYVTTAGTWNYTGTSVSSTDLDLKSGLNMIGVPNCTIDISGAMGSTDYRYVARWNATETKFEVYNANAPSAFHDFTTMVAGEGYFISAGSDYALTLSCTG